VTYLLWFFIGVFDLGQDSGKILPRITNYQRVGFTVHRYAAVFGGHRAYNLSDLCGIKKFKCYSLNKHFR